MNKEVSNKIAFLKEKHLKKPFTFSNHLHCLFCYNLCFVSQLLFSSATGFSAHHCLKNINNLVLCLELLERHYFYNLEPYFLISLILIFFSVKCSNTLSDCQELPKNYELWMNRYSEQTFLLSFSNCLWLSVMLTPLYTAHYCLTPKPVLSFVGVRGLWHFQGLCFQFQNFHVSFLWFLFLSFQSLIFFFMSLSRVAAVLKLSGNIH